MKLFTIIKNTDSVDIDQKCLGLSVDRPSIPRDVMNYIKTDRGLHVQIRHNRDPQTAAQAEALSCLLSAAPDLLEACEKLDSMFRELEWFNGDEKLDDEQEAIAAMRAAIKKAKGET